MKGALTLFQRTRLRLTVLNALVISGIYGLLLLGLFAAIRLNLVDSSSRLVARHVGAAVHVRGQHLVFDPDLAERCRDMDDREAVTAIRILNPIGTVLYTYGHGRALPPNLGPVRIGSYEFHVAGHSIQRTLHPLGDPARPAGYLEVVLALEPVESLFLQLFNVLLLGVPVALIASLAGGFWLSGFAMEPIEHAFEGMKRFTSDAAHELRTPLTALRAQAELLLSEAGSTSAATHRRLEVLDQEARRLERLTDSLLFLSRQERRTLERRLFGLDEVLEDVVEALAPLAASKSLAIATAIAPDLPCRGAPEDLYRVFWNLVENAIKYTPVGGRISLEAASRGSSLVVKVADNGLGIPDTQQARIFERFYRSEQARSSAGGNGLGLAIVQAIVQAHGGSVGVESIPGAGSTFTVALPQA